MSDSIVLAFDTSTLTLSVALKARERLWERVIDCTGQTPMQQHSQLLLPTIQNLLDQAEITYAQLTHLIVTKGPGSFTGIRLGLAAAQGLQMATKAQCFAATSLQVLAFQGRHQNPKGTTLLALIDNQRGQYYGQVFLPNFQASEPAKIWSQEEVASFPHQIIEQILTPHATSLINLVETYPNELETDLQPFYLVTPTYAKLAHYTS